MRWVASLAAGVLTSVAACGMSQASASGRPSASVLVQIAHVEDCNDVTGTDCPARVTQRRVVRVGTDGKLSAVRGPTLAYPLAPAPPRWGLARSGTRVRVFA